MVRWRISFLRIFLILLTIGLSGPAARATASKPAESKPFAGYTKYAWYRARYEVNADGTDVETYDIGTKVLSQQGIAQANQTSINYSDTLQQARILAAYTLKSDGRRIDVPVSNFQEQISQGRAGNLPMFSDVRSKTVAFPDVAVGDTVVISYQILEKTAMFPGNFAVTETFPSTDVFDAGEVTITAPASLPLYVYQRGVDGGEVKHTGGSARRIWRWTYKNHNVVAQEDHAVSALDYDPVIVATTFKDYGAVAAAYNARAQPKAAVTPRVTQLAEQLTKNVTSTRAQAKAIYDWVAVNIQYANNEAGIGSVVPHAADLVIANRMGDCKDHTTLLKALLAAKGIASVPVLINAAPTYSLPPVASPNFDHMISYIPTLNLYADSTSRFTPFGALPISDSDKPVVHTIDFAEIERTPASGYRDNKVDTTTDLTIHANGDAEGSTTVSESGSVSDGLRAEAQYIDPTMKERMVRQALEHSGFVGTGTMTMSDPTDLSDKSEIAVHFALTDAYTIPGPAALNVSSPMSGAGSAVARFLSSANEQHTVNFQCAGIAVKEHYVMKLPATLKVLALPPNVELHNKILSYRATYELKGSAVLASRELEDRTPTNVCTPADAAAAKDFIRSVRHDLRAQILYQ